MASKDQTAAIAKKAKELVQDILDLLGGEAKATARVEEGVIKIKIEGEDLGLLIGYHGENLEALQLITGIILNKKLEADPWQPVIIDVGDWRKQREESLRSFVAKEVEKLSNQRDSLVLPPMPPAQRRTVHLIVATYPNLTSESAGEEPNRYVVIKRAKET